MDLQVTTGSPKSKGPDWAFEQLQWRGNLWHCGPAFACKSSRCHEQQWDQTLKSSGFEASKEKISCKKKMEILYIPHTEHIIYIYIVSCHYVTKNSPFRFVLTNKNHLHCEFTPRNKNPPPPRSQWSRLFERTRSSHLCSSNWVQSGSKNLIFFEPKIITYRNY